MKILHTADWHLGKRLENFSRLDEQKAVLDEITAIAAEQDVDAFIIAGDLFDTFNPSSGAVDLFYRALKKISRDGACPVIAIAGNHDSPDRIEAPDPLARECGIFFAGNPDCKVQKFQLDSGLKVLNSGDGFLELKLPKFNYPLRLLLTPYANEYRLKRFLGVDDPEAELRNVLESRWMEQAGKYCDDRGVNILLAHLFFMKKGASMPEEPDSEKPILHIGGAQAIFTENIPEQIQYAALGHLHRYQVIDDNPCPAVYSSSPLSYSFSEASQEKNVVILEIEPGKEARFNPVKLTAGKELIRKRFQGTGDALDWLNDHPDCLVELTMETEDYLSAAERKQLYNAHAGIVTLIPEVKAPRFGDDQTGHAVDLDKGMKDLFVDYFKNRHGHQPDEAIMELFREMIAEKDQ